MAFRSQALGLVLAVSAAAQTFDIKGGGILKFEDDGITYKDRKNRTSVWVYEHLQQIRLEDTRIQIVTYEDNARWKLGLDKQYDFTLANPDRSFRGLRTMLQSKLGSRFVAAIPDPPADPEWKLLVKRLGTLKGSEGTLYLAQDRVVYVSAARGESRVWRLEDLDNVNSSGRFELTLTTYERARTHYGSMRSFNFRLKEPIRQSQVDDLWKRIESVHRRKS